MRWCISITPILCLASLFSSPLLLFGGLAGEITLSSMLLLHSMILLLLLAETMLKWKIIVQINYICNQ